MGFLPQNTTSVLQPLDQGIIHSFKAAYKRAMIEKFIAYAEANSSPTPPDVLDAIFRTKEAGNSVSEATIINCFKKDGFTSANDVSSMDDMCHENKGFDTEINEMILEEDDNLMFENYEPSNTEQSLENIKLQSEE